MEELLFIINPVAGSGRCLTIKTIIEEDMKDYPGSFSIILTKNPKEATQIAYESNTNTIIAVGGDGTVTEVAKGIIRRGYGTLGIIPGGTGNDFIKTLGISKDPREALETIRQGKFTKVDIGLANGYKFLNIGSIGLDAEVVHTVQTLKKQIKGRLSYILGVFITLIRFKRKDVIIEIDGKHERKGLVLFAIGNGKYYGGGLKMIPHAELNDGYLHGCIVKDVSKLRILTILPEVFKGKHLRHKKYAEIFKCKGVKIHSQEDIYMNLDGELFSPGKEIEFSLADEKLNILIP